MTIQKQNRTKIMDLVPHGLIVTSQWLLAQGIQRHSLDNYIKSGLLVAMHAGVYKRPDTQLSWQGLVCSLQRMGFGCTVGGLSALELNGLAHYLPLGEQTAIHLYSPTKMPKWLNKLLPDTQFVCHKTFNSSYSDTMFNSLNWSDHEFTLTFSTAELASLELLVDVPNTMSFEHADQLIEGLTTLSPRRLRKLLTQINHVKVKRLFFWFAQRHKHQWAAKVSPDEFDLGSGKRLIAKGGCLNKQFQITIPKAMAGGPAHE
jgi:hypothetical protein